MVNYSSELCTTTKWSNKPVICHIIMSYKDNLIKTIWVILLPGYLCSFTIIFKNIYIIVLVIGWHSYDWKFVLLTLLHKIYLITTWGTCREAYLVMIFKNLHFLDRFLRVLSEGKIIFTILMLISCNSSAQNVLNFLFPNPCIGIHDNQNMLPLFIRL